MYILYIIYYLLKLYFTKYFMIQYYNLHNSNINFIIILYYCYINHHIINYLYYMLLVYHQDIRYSINCLFQLWKIYNFDIYFHYIHCMFNNSFKCIFILLYIMINQNFNMYQYIIDHIKNQLTKFIINHIIHNNFYIHTIIHLINILIYENISFNILLCMLKNYLK